MPNAPVTPLVDLRDVLSRFGGDLAFLAECVDVLQHEAPGMLGSMREGIARGACDEVGRVAHTFKGAVSNFSAGGPAKTAAAIDELARSGRLHEAGPLVPRLEQEFADLLLELRAVMGTSVTEGTHGETQAAPDETL
jgi:HPt (histidine-containing phosphotransfer) domain-containing protein